MAASPIEPAANFLRDPWEVGEVRLGRSELKRQLLPPPVDESGHGAQSSVRSEATARFV